MSGTVTIGDDTYGAEQVAAAEEFARKSMERPADAPDYGSMTIDEMLAAGEKESAFPSASCEMTACLLSTVSSWKCASTSPTWFLSFGI